MVVIGIVGAAGRMGRAILNQAVREAGSYKVGALLEKTGSLWVGKLLEGCPVSASFEEAAKRCEVLIDFTSAEAATEHVEVASRLGRAMVVGATGFTETLMARLQAASGRAPVVCSPNMSLSANVLFDAVERMARLLPNDDIEVSEIHHRLKKDAPSGTALRLAEAAKRGRGQGFIVNGRKGLVGERNPQEIGIHALRGGDVVGDHTVYFLGQGERVELTHRVTSRDAFAQGALVAAQWVVGRPAGLYEMGHVLGLKPCPEGGRS